MPWPVLVPTSSFTKTLTTIPEMAIHITQRDKQVLQSIRDLGLASSDHIRYLHFPSHSRARKRLRQLWKIGLLARIERPTILGEGSKSKLYRIARKGAALIHDPEVHVSSTTRVRPISAQFAEHQLAINRFRVCVQLAVRSTPGVSLVNWIPDRGVKMEGTWEDKSRRQSSVIIPDSTFTLWSGNHSFAYFLEIDLGSTPLKRLRNKLMCYFSVFEHPELQVTRPHPGFRVLIVANSASRLKSLANAVRSLPPRVRRPDIFMLTLSTKFSYDRPQSVFGPIWTTLSADRSVTRQVPLFQSTRHSRQYQENHRCTA